MPSVVIKSTENGPNVIMVDGKTLTALCRCGQSSKKPYCDGTHRKVGFQAAAAEVPVLS
ncbi:MAG: CDGSH iron-sulfur domain-containing protein [Candidatus Marsarchaeota archaeon]|nr:CDGSH iron-sulfur domain-containing protein [Candidatus Marsarchaeota archaeon]